MYLSDLMLSARFRAIVMCHFHVRSRKAFQSILLPALPVTKPGKSAHSVEKTFVEDRQCETRPMISATNVPMRSASFADAELSNVLESKSSLSMIVAVLKRGTLSVCMRTMNFAQ